MVINLNDFWKKDINELSFKKLNKNIDTDVLIIGGGICGILCAYKLKSLGLRVVVVEKDKIASQRTNKTTAVATALQDLLYFNTIKNCGIDETKAYIDLTHKAILEYERLSKKYNFDFEKTSSYKYFNDIEILNKEIFALRSLGYKPKKLEIIPYIEGIAGAIELENQAQFNPIKLIYELAKELEIYEYTEVIKIEPNIAYTKDNNLIFAKNIIMATGYPIYKIKGLFPLRLTQKKSYVTVIKHNNLNISINAVGEGDKDIFYRSYKDYLIIGGNDSKTGEFDGGFRITDEYIKKYFSNCEIVDRWINQDTISLDGLPYISIFKKGIYIATGFNMWGMTNSMNAAILISDMIVKKRNRYFNYFSIKRKMPYKALLKNIKTAVINLFRFGKKCNHLGCTLKYNKELDEYECPCHGTKYDKDFNAIFNPGSDKRKKKSYIY